MEENKVLKIEVKSNVYRTYLETLSGIFKVTTETDLKVLTKLHELKDVNNRIRLTHNDRVDVLKELNIDTVQLAGSLANLKNKGLLIGSHGDYILDKKIILDLSKPVRILIELIPNN